MMGIGNTSPVECLVHAKSVFLGSEALTLSPNSDSPAALIWPPSSERPVHAVSDPIEGFRLVDSSSDSSSESTTSLEPAVARNGMPGSTGVPRCELLVVGP